MQWNPEFSLRSYQKAFCQAVRLSFTQGIDGQIFDRVLGVAGTGGGKTIMAAALILWEIMRRNGRVLFLADRDELVSQARDKIYRSTEILTDCEQGPSIASLESDVVVASVQSLSIPRRLDRFPKDHFSLIIADEAHLSLADTWQRVFGWFDSQLLGITATPARADKKKLMGFYQHKAYEISLFDLIDAKALVPVTVETASVKVDIGNASLSEGEDNEEQAQAVAPFWNAIIDEWQRLAGNRKTLIFHPSIAASKEFSAMLQSRGIASAHIDGGSKNREELKQDFASGKIQVLNNAQLLTTGYDEPTIECILILRLVGSKTSYQQMVGRGTRLWCPNGCNEYCECPGAKRDMLLLDLLWQYAKKGVMRPEDLIAESDEQRAGVAEWLRKPGKKNLQEVDRAVFTDREQQVLNALRRLQGRQARTFDARTVSALINEPALLDYEPMARWEMKPPTPRQLTALQKFGVDAGQVKCMGEAKKLLDYLIPRAQNHGATLAQVAALARNGVMHAHALTFNQASLKLDELFGAKA